jgi:hypothetical protein
LAHFSRWQNTNDSAFPATYPADAMNQGLYCHVCGDSIGVYEPLIALADGHAHETSRAAHDHPDGLPTPCYHRACFERLQRTDLKHTAA